jgi:uncharacterized low-complexity protein
MAHQHAHPADKNYYLDQICSIGACAALGLISVLMYWNDKLQLILVPAFHVPVLVGGITLMVLSAIRFVVLWNAPVAAHNHDHHHHDHHHSHHRDGDCGHGDCDHDHEQGHNHDHTAGECGAGDCGHDHSHAWTPAKYAVLLLPVVLYLLQLPNEAFSADYMRRNLDASELESSTREVAAKGKRAAGLGFRELADAAYDPKKREYFEGFVGELRGVYMPVGNNDKEFTLVRLNMKCCGADAIPVQVRIVSPSPVNIKPGTWVAVEGKVEFRKASGKDRWFAMLILDSAGAVREIPPEPNPYDL